jgi:hypothetical protein
MGCNKAPTSSHALHASSVKITARLHGGSLAVGVLATRRVQAGLDHIRSARSFKMNQSAPPTLSRPEIADAGRIRTGAGARILPPALPVSVKDSGRIRLGAGARLARSAR